MKSLLKRFLRIVSLVLIIGVVAAFFPYAQPWITSLLAGVKYQSISYQLTHKFEEVGELTVIRYTDTGLMSKSLPAALIGSAATYEAPYSYEISFGFDLSDVEIRAEEKGLSIYLPEIIVLGDPSFKFTDTPKITDPFKQLNETRRKQMEDEQKAECREIYDKDPQYAEQAWESACSKLKELFEQWAGQSLPLSFHHGPAPVAEDAAAE